MAQQPSTRRRNARAARVTSSASRATRSKASAPSAQKKTTSAGKAAGRTPTVDSRAQRAKVSTATVTRSGGGTPGSAKVTTGQGGVKAPRAGIHAAIAGEVMRARPVADGTLKGKPTGPKKGPAVPKRVQSAPSKPQTAAKSFDSAFAAARKAGQKEFTWRGSRYRTRME
jgi:lipoprotein-anchoring transpeptidase ErfK/SrfK